MYFWVWSGLEQDLVVPAQQDLVVPEQQDLVVLEQQGLVVLERLGASWGVLERLGAVLEASWSALEPLRAFLERLGSVLGASWAVLDAPGGRQPPPTRQQPSGTSW